MDYPKADRELTLEDREDLVDRLTIAATELQSLAADESFRFHSLTSSVARLVQDWCIIVGPDIKASQERVADNNGA